MGSLPKFLDRRGMMETKISSEIFQARRVNSV